ncbi:hypothetical protein T439DRAFT_180012 [Meredithblackwellia eburnea MCA 4105]
MGSRGKQRALPRLARKAVQAKTKSSNLQESEQKPSPAKGMKLVFFHRATCFRSILHGHQHSSSLYSGPHRELFCFLSFRFQHVVPSSSGPLSESNWVGTTWGKRENVKGTRMSRLLQNRRTGEELGVGTVFKSNDISIRRWERDDGNGESGKQGWALK